MHNSAPLKSSPDEGRKWSVVRGFAYIFLGILSADFLITIAHQSLWLDELHSAWTISGPANEITERAQAGNQSPLYFWLLATFSKTLSTLAATFQLPQLPVEVRLRLPSMIAWWSSLAVAASILRCEARRCQVSTWIVPAVLMWPIFDQIQWFYATEARPYAVVQLLSLAGWCCVVAIFAPSHSDVSTACNSRPQTTWMVAWTAVSVASFYMHATASLSVLCQWLTGGLLIFFAYRSSKPIAPEALSLRKLAMLWTVSIGCVAVAWLPALQSVAPVWQRRAMWASFANDISLWNTLNMFPLLPILVPVLCVRLFGMLRGTENRATSNRMFVWWCALLGPWIAAWAITALGIAPIFHRRFIIASAWPLMIVAAYELLQIRSTWWRWGTLAAVLSALTVSQGTVDQLRRGRIVGWLRVEDWRSASQYLQRGSADAEPLMCASGLIEANQLTPPITTKLNDYLTFPLTGPYHITSTEGNVKQVHALVNDAGYWHEQILAANVAGENEFTCLIVYRGSLARFESKLLLFADRLHNARWLYEVGEHRSFGTVQIIRLILKRK